MNGKDLHVAMNRLTEIEAKIHRCGLELSYFREIPDFCAVEAFSRRIADLRSEKCELLTHHRDTESTEKKSKGIA